VIGGASRVQAGSVDHCEHGKEVLTLRYIDVRPQKYFTQEMPLPLQGKMCWTKTFAAENGGTRINTRVARPEGSNILTNLLLGGFGYVFMRKTVRGIFEREFELLKDYFESGKFRESQSR